MIDTHTHVVSKKIKSILAASDIDDSKENTARAKENTNIWAAVGIHPRTKIENVDKSINYLDKLIEENKKWIVNY